MNILFNPQVSSDLILYEFEKDIVYVRMVYGGRSSSDTFDFRGLPDGELDMGGDSGGAVETSLPVNPIINANKVDGVLNLELRRWIPNNATRKECFPEWMSYKEVENFLEQEKKRRV